MRQAIGGGQVSQLEAGFAIRLGRPLKAIRAQGVSGAHHVQQVPAATVVLPLTPVRVNQVAPKHEAGDFIVKTNGVIAHAHGARPRQCLLNVRRKLVFGQTFFQTRLRRDAGDQARLRVWQKIIGGLAVQHDWLTDLMEIRIGTNGRELGWARAPGVDAKSFIVVPEKGVGHKMWVGILCYKTTSFLRLLDKG